MANQQRSKKVQTQISLSVGPGGEFPSFRIDAIVWARPGEPVPNSIKRMAFRKPLLALLDQAFPDYPLGTQKVWDPRSGSFIRK